MIWTIIKMMGRASAMDKDSTDGNRALASSFEGRKAQGILVLGMHRSGTSACTRVLNMLGCALSDRLIGAGEGNENGHWEAVDAVELNEEMLASAGSSHEDWGPVSPEWRQSAIRDLMVERASVVIKEHSRLGPLFAIKDPRMCRLGDVWIEAAIAAEVNPLVVVMLRNPIEVMDSLESRDLMVSGYAELLWLRHVLDAENSSRGHTRIFFRYDQLLSNWQSLVTKCRNGLGVALPRNTPKVHAEISQFLSQSHRHQHADHAAVLDDPTRSPWLRQVFEIMLRWSEGGEDAADYPALDEVRAEMDRSYSVFARLLLSEDVTGAAGSGRQLREQIDHLQKESAHHVEALRIAVEAAESERAAVDQRTTELESELHRANADLAEVQALVLAEQQALRDAGERTTELEAALHQANADLAEVQALVLAEQQAKREADQRHAEALSELHAHEIQKAELTGQLATLQSTILQRNEEIAQLFAQLREGDALRLQAIGESERERDRRIALEHEVETAQNRIAALQSQLAQTQATARQEAEARIAELAQITLALKEQQQISEEAATQASEARAEAKRLLQQVEQLTRANEVAKADRTSNERNLAARFDELARLTAIVTDEVTRADTWETASQWLSDVRRIEEGFPAWWAIMPSSWRQRRAHRRYRSAGLFDAAAYLALYPDVAEQGMDPIRHYILHGMAEGRTRPQPS